ncbi:MAG: M48 family metalloprotease [Gemmatimonadota bacterium]|nr:M48 family metalloprotease [Gemmatimonadota bacterium]
MKLQKPILFASLLAVTACAVNPATGRRELSLVSEAGEIEMGREADPQIRAQMGLVENEALQSYVSDMGLRLASVSERPDLPWTFHVVDEPGVNAFALPGGFIYVTRGILAHFDSEAELAGVLGHEIGHVTARHSVSQMSRQQLQQIGLGVGMVLSEDVRQLGGLLSAGMQLINLRYSRGDETQSDELGLRYVSLVGYDPTAMIGVFEMLAQAGGSGQEEGRIPEWQLTHPYPENRADNIRARIAEEGLDRSGTVARDAYLDRIDGMVFGEDPRQGYFKGSRFVHPELAFDLTFPEGWRTINQRSVVAAIEPSEQAVITLQVAEDTNAPAEALREFLSQEGITSGPVREDGTGGIERARAEFEATTEEGTVRGEVAFIRHEDVAYRLLGYAPNASAWGGQAQNVAATISSFQPLTDAAILGVEPWTIEIRTLSEATSLMRYAAEHASPVELEDLARLNRVTPEEVLSSGARIKWVVGAPLP